MEERELRSSHSSLGRKYLLYRGYYYDVTEFIPRHPGGETLISFYVNNGEDASDAIEQFHFRSEKRVRAILKSFPRRKATEEELLAAIGSKEKYERNQALTKDFAQLFHEIKAEGLFEPSGFHVFLRWLEITVIALLGVHLFVEWGYKLLGAALISIASGRSAWVVHEGGHISLTGKPGFDRWFQGHIYGIFCGLSGASWRNHHNQHHAMPQHLHNDIDMDTLPILAFHEKVVQKRKQFGFLVKYQKWLIYLIQSNLVGFYWKYVEDPLYCIKHGYYSDLLHMVFHNVMFIPMLGPTWYFICGCTSITYIFLNSTLSHTHLPITEEPTHWVEYGLVHTANVTPSWFMDYFMGYLNYQIEHHLFPTMPQFRNQLISKRVKALAEKHGLPYHVYDWWTILRMTLNNLGKVSEEVDNKLRMEEEDNKETVKDESSVPTLFRRLWKSIKFNLSLDGENAKSVHNFLS